MKRWFAIAIAGSIFLLTAYFINAQPERILLDNKEAYNIKQRPPVVFPHSKHMEGDLSCKDCHHRYEGKKNVIEESDLEEGKPGIRCAECHGAKVRPKLRDAFHRQCIGCHDKLSRKGKDRAPRLCGECHCLK